MNFAPLAPQSWGEQELSIFQSSPELGDLGGDRGLGLSSCELMRLVIFLEPNSGFVAVPTGTAGDGDAVVPACFGVA